MALGHLHQASFVNIRALRKAIDCYEFRDRNINTGIWVDPLGSYEVREAFATVIVKEVSRPPRRAEEKGFGTVTTER